jgi:hypothetical protein
VVATWVSAAVHVPDLEVWTNRLVPVHDGCRGVDRKGVVMSRTRVTSLVIAASMLAACGGGDDASAPDDGTVDSSPSGSVDTTTDTTTTTAPVATTSEPPPSSSTTPTTVLIDVTDAEPWRVELPDPVGTMLAAWADRPPIEQTPADPPEGVEAQLAWIYEDLIELWRGNLDLVALGLNDDVLERPHRETSPRAAIDLIGAAAAILRDSYVVIATDAELAVATGSPGAQLFSAWSELARNWVTATELVRVGMAEARDFSADGQACFIVTVDGDDFCEGPAGESAFTMMSNVDDSFQTIDAVDLDEISLYDSALGFDECAAWDTAVAATGLTADEELRIWIAIDDSDLDQMFVGISECGWQDNREEDPLPDQDADMATFLAYLAAVAEAIADSGYDETVYDFGSGAEDERRYYEFTSAQATQSILTAARDTASQLWSTAYDVEFATKLYVVASIEIDDWNQLDDRELDWEDLGNQVCDGWTMVIEDYSTDQLAAIDAAVDELGLGGTLIPDGCG